MDLRNTIQYASALSPTPNMSTSDAIHAIRRHLTGFGIYGAFSIIVPLYGGGGEISQAFCRAAAVKGTTYILGRDIRRISTDNTNEYPVTVDFDVAETEDLPSVRCKNVVRASPSLSFGLCGSHSHNCCSRGYFRVVICLRDTIFGRCVDCYSARNSTSRTANANTNDRPWRWNWRMPCRTMYPLTKAILTSGVIYCSTHASGDNAVEDLNLAENLIIQLHSGRTKGSNSGVSLGLI